MNCNKLIQDIMYKADEAEIPYDEDYGNTDFLADSDPRRVEIFAKMIVNECIKVCREQRDPQNLNYKPSERFAESLQQHFGIYK